MRKEIEELKRKRGRVPYLPYETELPLMETQIMDKINEVIRALNELIANQDSHDR